MEYHRLKVTFEENVARLTLNHPEVLNAVSLQMIRELNQVMDEIEDPAAGVRCLLITGEGRAFCVGANLSDPEGRMGDAKKELPLKEWYDPFFRRLRDFNLPIVTAVNGPAAGVGMSLALMGDLVLAARSAFFLQAFRHIGVIPDGGSTFVLPRLIGWPRALEMSLLGERVSAEKALGWGMINQVFDDDQLMSKAWNLARSLASGPTVALGLTRKAYWKSMDNTCEKQLKVESEYQDVANKTEDYKEGVSAFLEKRPAQFKGK
jgi:2-(1,2-epoxy-1,2-dihydrophenyl)acetyl-CoA isomerase